MDLTKLCLSQSLGSGERATLLFVFLLSKLPKAGFQHKQKPLLSSLPMPAPYILAENSGRKSSLALKPIKPAYQRYPRTPKEMLDYSSSVTALLG